MPQRIKAMRIDDAAITVANRTTEVGAATGVVGWMTQVNWVGWAGVLIALIGLGSNIYFQRRRDKRERAESQARDKREQEAHRARMDAIKARCDQ